MSGVVAVIVVFGSPEARLRRCVTSLLASSGDDLREIVLVDNASRSNAGVAARIAQEVTAGADTRVRCRVVVNHRNLGFSAAVNRGVGEAHPGADLVMVLNDDATVDPAAVQQMSSALRAAPERVAGVAPKMLLSGHAGVIDAVGICVNARGEGANVGLGQPDLGQFDDPSPCFGVCFGAAMIRRSALDPTAVGPLWERSFLYYEDVEWSWRARLLGYELWTVPGAVVHHEMSASSREDGYDFKHRYIERNLLLCAARCAEAGTALAIWRWRAPRLVMRFLRRDRGAASGRAVAEAIIGLPRELRARRELQRRRVSADAEIVSFSDGLVTYFDPVTYTPTDPDSARADAQRRLGRRTPTGASPGS